MKRLILLILVCVLSACGGVQRENPWPSAERVQALTKSTGVQTSPERKTYGEFVDWEMLHSPQIAGAVPLRAVTPLEKLLDAQTSQHSHLVATEASSCLSRELARFLVERGTPTQTLLKFMARRCGLVHPRIGYSLISYDATTDEEAMARSGANHVQDAVAPFIQSSTPVEFGIGMFSNEKKAYFVIAAVQKRVEIEPVNMTVEGIVVEVKGASLMPNVGHMWASINQGTHGYETCERDVQVALPSFRFTCNILPGDPFATVSIGQKQKDKFLGEQAAYLMVASNAQPDNVYRPPRIRYELLQRVANEAVETELVDAPLVDTPVNDSVTAPSEQTGEVISANPVELPQQLRFTPLPEIARRPDTYEADIIALVNAVRSGQNLAPIVLAENQSKTVSGLTPAMFEAEDPQLKDEIAMAIMAGWDVAGPVVNGNFQSGSFATTDPVEHLDALLDEPDGRAHLLDPALSALAIGARLDSSSQVIFAGYHFAPEETAQRQIGHVFRHINAQRQQLGLPPAKESAKTRAYANSLSSKIAANEMDSKEAADKLMSKLVANHNRAVRGYWMRVNDLSEIQLPRPVLAKKDLTVSIAVALHQDPGFPWYEYVVIITYLH